MLSKLPPASQKSRREFEALFANNFQPFANGFYLLANKLKSYTNSFLFYSIINPIYEGWSFMQIFLSGWRIIKNKQISTSCQ
jgi:hypothetical protein